MNKLPLLACALAISMFCGTVTGAGPNNPPAFQFSGKVVDSEGHPLGGVVIERYEGAPGALLSPGDLERKGQTTTDADGAFRLPLSGPQSFFLARKAGYALGWRMFWNPQGDLSDPQFVLTAPSAVAGVVLDEKDKPVPDAEVFAVQAQSEAQREAGGRLIHYFFGKLTRECFHARTGTDGRFRIEGFPTQATTDLMVKAAGKALRQQPTGDSGTWKAGEQDIKLVLEPAGIVEGKVVARESGQSLSGARLWLQPDQPGFFGIGPGQQEPALSDADGHFRIGDVGAGSYRVRAVFATNGVPDWVAETVPVVVESGQTTRDIQVPATRGGLLEVVLVGKTDRQPMPEVNVSAYAENYQAGGISSSNGVALLRLPVGEYQVSAYKNRGRSDPTSASVQAGQTNRLELELTPPVKVTGTVRQPDGQPAPGLEVRIVGGYAPEGTVNPKTDAAGHFETEWDPQRYGRGDMRYCVLVRDPAHNLAATEDIEESSGPLELKLASALTLIGRVQGSGGQPVTNANAALIFRNGNTGMYLNGLATKTNAPGRFEIPALPEGRRYGVMVSAPGYGQTTVNEIAAEPTNGLIELDPIELKVANLKLAGQVLDSEDKPVTGAYINLYGEGQPNGNARTDREGRFSFDQVCEGTVQLSANARNSYGNVSAEGGATNVVLRLGQNIRSSSSSTARTVKGTVIDPGGKPAAGARVAVFPSFGGGGIKADANGAFKLTWNPEPWQQGAACLVARDLARNLVTALEIEPDATSTELKLKPGGVITGRVEDASGNGIPKATLDVMFQFGRMGSSWSENPVRTDAQGRFEITGLAQGLHYQVNAAAPGYGRLHEEVEIEESETPRVNLPAFVLKLADLPLAGQVVNADEKPVSGANIQIIGDNQPQVFTASDRQGRFKFKVCEGPVRLYVNLNDSFTQATLEAGDTNALITLTPRSRSFSASEPPRRALQGSPLPDLASVGLSADTLPAGKPGLVCLLDCEQRPSRRMLRQLTDQNDSLKEKGVTIAAIQAAVLSDPDWQSFKESNTTPFPIGRVPDKSPKTRWATAPDSLPWLILVDGKGRVAAEGFALEELESKLQALGK